MMHTSVETAPANKTSAKRMAIMLALAFLGSLLSGGATAAAIVAAIILPPGSDAMAMFSQDVRGGIVLALLALLLFLASFWTLSLYPKPGLRQVIAGFLGVLSLAIVFTIGYYIPTSVLDVQPKISVTVGIPIAICLLVSNRITGWASLGGLVLGVLVGISLRNSNLYPASSYIYAPIWLNAVFFTELFSGRASWRVALFGFFLLGGLVALSVLLTRFG